MNLIIRWAEAIDIRDLAYVHTQSYHNTYEGIIPKDFLEKVTLNEREKYFENTLSVGIEKVAIMLVDEKAIGLMIVVLQNGEDLAEISAIYFLGNYSGKGYGKLLLNWGLDRIKELGYVEVFLWVLKENLNAICFYERQGFLFDNTERNIIRGKTLRQLRAQKTI